MLVGRGEEIAFLDASAGLWQNQVAMAADSETLTFHVVSPPT
jgi:hypothetical protein